MLRDLSRAGLMLGITLLAAMPAAGQELRTIRVGTIPIVDTTPLIAAIEEGYFAEEGLEVDTTPAPGGAASLPALAAGQFDFAFANTTSALLGVGQGIEFRFATAGCSTGPEGPDLAGLVAPSDSGITTGQDLEGKRLAVNNRNNIMWIRAADWIRKTGGDVSQVQFVEIPFPQMVDAMINGQVDAGMVNEPFLTAGMQTHGDALTVPAWPMSFSAPNGVVSEYVTTQQFYDENPDVVEKFARALSRGVEWVKDNQGNEEWENLVSSFTKIEPERLRGIALPVYDEVIEPQKIADMVALMQEHGLLDAPLDVDELILPTALEDYAD